MRLSYLLVCLCLLFHESQACSCIPLKPLNAEIFNRYPYVARVRIKTLEKFALPGTDSTRSELAKFTVDVIENFKNPLPAEFILDAYQTSCDIGLRPNAEWIIFAKDNKGYATVFPCDYSIEYDGGRWVRNVTRLRLRSGDELLNTVRQLTGKPIQTQNGRIEKFYWREQRALLTTYRQGGRDEERILWHENGKLWGRETYKNGLKDGPSVWWYENGRPNSQETFAAGVAIDTSRYWYPTDSDTVQRPSTSTPTEQARDSINQFYSRSRLRAIVIADRRGSLLSSQHFDLDGRLVDEVVGVPETGLECRTAYDKQGNVNFLIVTRTVPSPSQEPTHKIVYRIDYEKDGSRQVAYYDPKGRLTRWVSIKDGIETVLKENYYPD